MTKLQFLNVFLTERLMLAAQEIYKSVEDTILEYQEEIAIRERENDHLRRKLRDAGIEIWPGYPSMGHEERIPIQIKDKRDPRTNQVDDQLRGHGACNTPENMFNPQRVGNDYPQEGPHTSSLSQNQGVENRERDHGSRGPSRHVKVESAAHMRNQPANAVDCPHQKSPLQAHMSSFCCKVCGEAFSHIGHLHVHVQVHTREKPYRCGVCGKCCSSSGRLQEHQRSHTGEKPFRCQICGKGFTQMAHLKVHMRIHTGEKPYSCPVCGKCFSRSDKIKRHLQTHSREGSYFSGQ
uniref:C2H2-type domain-containing protein n=1 Tax=Takifugu rubripes TaxID=31033 RepID=A0A3B5JUJ6_TAKRU